MTGRSITVMLLLTGVLFASSARASYIESCQLKGRVVSKPVTLRIYFMNEQTPPFLIYVGKKTYPFIKVANERFLKALHPYQNVVKPIFLNKKHIPMVLQYFWPWSSRFDETVKFMNKNKL